MRLDGLLDLSLLGNAGDGDLHAVEHGLDVLGLGVGLDSVLGELVDNDNRAVLHLAADSLKGSAFAHADGSGLHELLVGGDEARIVLQGADELHLREGVRAGNGGGLGLLLGDGERGRDVDGHGLAGAHAVDLQVNGSGGAFLVRGEGGGGHEPEAQDQRQNHGENAGGLGVHCDLSSLCCNKLK